jgi:hypothetical protein
MYKWQSPAWLWIVFRWLRKNRILNQPPAQKMISAIEPKSATARILSGLKKVSEHSRPLLLKIVAFPLVLADYGCASPWQQAELDAD